MFEHVAKNFAEGRVKKDELRAQLTKTRIAYKKVQFMLEYYYPRHIKAYINGAPLPHLDPYPYRERLLPDAYYKDPDYIDIAPLDYQEPNAYMKPREVVEPEGLQVLDALINDATERAKILALASELAKRSKIVIQALLKRRYIEDYQIIEAIRLELVRVFSLGLTGFDTPGSLNAIDESKAAFSAIENAVLSVVDNTPTSGKAELEHLFALAATLLNDQNFNSFDRLQFLKLAVNPLYRSLQQTREALKLKAGSDITHETPSWNAGSENIFADDFLNPYFYTLLKKEQDSDALRELGGKLFYDKTLSLDETLSCASCHQPSRAFADPRAQSIVERVRAVAHRNAPSIINAVYSDRFFYDLRAFSLEEQINHVVENPLEFNTSLDAIAVRIGARNEYSELFARAFGHSDQPVNRYRVATALSAYVASLRSFNSPFDRYVRGEIPRLDQRAIDGFNLFMGKAACGTCHFAPTFSGLVPPLYRENDSEVLGVLEQPGAYVIDPDPGRAGNGEFQENIAIFRRSFKTVTVRNIELTSPYFHNGAYESLDEVLDFYDKGGAQGMGLHYELPHQTLAAEPLDLTDDEKDALKAFLLSLTDDIAIKKFSSVHFSSQ